MEDEERPRPIEVGPQKDWSEGPHDELLDHEHPDHAGAQSNSTSISKGSHIDIVPVLASGNVRPVLLHGGPIVSGILLQDVASEELSAQLDGKLMVGGDASILPFQIIEIVLCGCVQLGSQEN